MAEALHVFLDTQAHYGAGFNYGQGRLQEVLQLAQLGRITLLTTDITQRELKSNIDERLREAVSLLQKLRDKGSILRHLQRQDLGQVFEPFDSAAASEELVAIMEAFHKDAGAVEIPASNQKAGPIFELYFGQAPPFGAGKKKAEFPDAFVLAALRDYAEEKGVTVVVVSDDGDFKDACKTETKIRILSHIDTLLEEIASADHSLSWTIAESEIKRLRPDIDQLITEKFEALGFYLTDENGDVNVVTVDEIALEEYHIVEVRDETVWARLEVEVSFSAEIRYDDMSTATYDREDDRYFIHHEVNTTVERTEEVVVALELTIELAREEAKLTRVELDRTDVGVAAVEDWY